MSVFFIMLARMSFQFILVHRLRMFLISVPGPVELLYVGAEPLAEPVQVTNLKTPKLKGLIFLSELNDMNTFRMIIDNFPPTCDFTSL